MNSWLETGTGRQCKKTEMLKCFKTHSVCAVAAGAGLGQSLCGAVIQWCLLTLKFDGEIYSSFVFFMREVVDLFERALIHADSYVLISFCFEASSPNSRGTFKSLGIVWLHS